jgi:hypothetical protein
MAQLLPTKQMCLIATRCNGHGISHEIGADGNIDLAGRRRARPGS